MEREAAVEKNGLWMEDALTKTPEFNELRSCGMVAEYVDDNYPVKFVKGTYIPDFNAYKAKKEVGEYWRYLKEKRKSKRYDFLKSAFLLFLGSAIALFFEHIGAIIRFIASLF